MPTTRKIELHPHDHAPSDLGTTEWDVIVIGAGSTGENVAGRAAAGGLSVVVVEAELVGGECSYWACTPSKSLLRPGEALQAAQSVEGAKEAVTGELDAAAVLKRRDHGVHDWRDDGQVEWLDSVGVALVRGSARISGERRVEVTGYDGESVTLSARKAVAICVGSEAALPPVDGLAAAHPWTAREGTSASEVPQRLLVIGGGVVGCELATAYESLGSTVTLVEVGDGLLAGNEPEAGKRVAAALRKRGVDVRIGATIASVRREHGSVVAELEQGDPLRADEILVAAGRKPRTSDIGLESVGLEPGGYLDVDDQMTVRGIEGGWLYAAGDCNGRALLTHQGKYQARVCGDVIVARANGQLDAAPWSRHSATADHRAVPQVAFTDPQVASVGLTEQKARDVGLRVRAVEFELGDVAGAGEYADDYDGWAQMLVDEDRGVVVGVTFVGPAAGELIHAATIAVVGEVPLERLWHAVPSYPTISEIWLRLMETYGL